MNTLNIHEEIINHENKFIFENNRDFIDSINKTLEYSNIEHYLTDKCKKEASLLLNKIYDLTDGLKIIHVKDFITLKTEVQELDFNYFFNRDKYLKTTLEVFKVIEQKFLNSFGLIGKYYLNPQNIEDTTRLLELIHCSSIYNDSLYKYEDKIKEANNL